MQEIYMITDGPDLHGPVIFGDSFELVPGPRSLFQYHVGRRDSIQCTHVFSLCKIDSIRGNHIMQALTKEKHVYINQSIMTFFITHMKSLIMCIINKMKMNYWWCHCTTFNVQLFTFWPQTTCIHFAKLYFDNVLYFFESLTVL